MITIFNRRELLVVLSTQKLFKIQNALSEAGIPYAVRTLGSFAAADSHNRWTVGVNQDARYQYRIFVHRDDYDQAVVATRAAQRDR